MRGPLVALVFISLSLAWLVFFGAGVQLADWNAAMLFLGATALFYWSFRSGQTAPHMALWQTASLWALPAFAIFQLIPFPPSILEVLSPARAFLTGSLAAVVPNLTTAPIATAPSAAMFGFFGLLSCLVVFSLMRDLAWRFAARTPWMPVIPFVLIAALEAAIGVVKLVGGARNPIHGTLYNFEHFAALLEPALPFTLVFGFISFRRHQTQSQPSSPVPAIRAACSWFAALLIFVALIRSPSQTSHVVVTASLFLLLSFALIPRLKTAKLRLYGLAIASAIAVITVLTVAPPTDFEASLAELGAGDKASSAEARMLLWNNSGSLMSEYRWFGAAMGGFESSYLKYQGSTDLNRTPSPHNDILLMLITFGVVGSSIVVLVIGGAMRGAIMGAVYRPEESRRLLAACIAAALIGVLLRGSMESALSLPVTALSFAWLAGISQASGLD